VILSDRFNSLIIVPRIQPRGTFKYFSRASFFLSFFLSFFHRPFSSLPHALSYEPHLEISHCPRMSPIHTFLYAVIEKLISHYLQLTVYLKTKHHVHWPKHHPHQQHYHKNSHTLALMAPHPVYLGHPTDKADAEHNGMINHQNPMTIKCPSLQATEISDRKQAHWSHNHACYPTKHGICYCDLHHLNKLIKKRDIILRNFTDKGIGQRQNGV
jgi:hypothetical protein